MMHNSRKTKVPIGPRPSRHGPSGVPLPQSETFLASNFFRSFSSGLVQSSADLFLVSDSVRSGNSVGDAFIRSS